MGLERPKRSPFGELFEPETLRAVEDEEKVLELLTEHISQQTDVAPLELLARVVLERGSDETASGIFTSYNSFLEALGNDKVRDELENIAFHEASENSTYDGLRELSKTFRSSVNTFFFDEHPQLKKLIRDYGVF